LHILIVTLSNNNIVVMILTIAKILPLIIFYLFFAFPDDFLYVSISPLGRLFAIFIILLYSSINTYYGIIMCVLIILYYRLEFIEKTSMFDSYMLIGDTFFEPFTEKEEPKVKEFREKNCKNNELMFKNNKVKNENASHIFPELEFLNDFCNPCDEKCGISIQEKLQNEESIAYPKTDDNWVFNIWNTWFSNEKAPPYASNTYNGKYSQL